MRILNLESHPTAGAVAARAADIVTELCREKPDAVLLLPAGNTPLLLYRELLQRHAAGTLDLSRAHLFQLDELIGVGRDDARSFHHFLRRELLHGLSRDGARDHLLDGAAADPVAEIQAHAARLDALGGADLVLLGIGRNGHVAFNEPGTARGECARLVELADTTVAGLRASFPPAELPTTGITLGLKEIFDSNRVVLLATGKGKSEILGSLVHSEPSPGCPASLLMDHDDFLVLADLDAAPVAPTARTPCTSDSPACP